MTPYLTIVFVVSQSDFSWEAVVLCKTHRVVPHVFRKKLTVGSSYSALKSHKHLYTQCHVGHHIGWSSAYAYGY